MATNYLPYAGPPTSDIWEVGQTTTDAVGNTWLCTGRGFGGQPGTSFLQTGSATEPTTIITAPPNSASVAASVGVAVHNTLGYDAILGAYLNVTAASVTSVSVGVGSAATPTTYPIVTGYTSANSNLIPITAYVPSGYYFLVQTSGGSITDTITAQWYPV